MYDVLNPPTAQEIAENRRKALAFLRTTNLRRTTGRMYDPVTGACCAKGAMLFAIGLDPRTPGIDTMYAAADMAFDMSLSFSMHLEDLNDGSGYSFPRMADYLAREWGIE